MKTFIGWSCLATGFALIVADLRITEGHEASILVPIALVMTIVGAITLGTFNGITEAHTEPDLTRMTDKQLEDLRREQMAAAYRAVHDVDYARLDAILADMGPTTAELDRRLTTLRAQAGWPTEGNH